MPSLKRYLHANPGQAPSNLWDDIPPLSKSAKEATGFDTQKPLELLRRVILASSDPDDLVLDPFCGCGTAVVAAHELGRRWCGIDVTHLAVGLMEQRLRDLGAAPRVVGAPVDLAGAQALAARDPFQFETWAVTRLDGFRPNAQQVHDQGVDGRMRYTASEDAAKKTTYGTVLAQVKAGKTIPIDAVRAFRTAMDNAKAELGVFITLEPLSQRHGAWTEAARMGKVEVRGREYDRLQLWSIQDFFQARRPNLPPPAQTRNPRLL